MLQDISPIKLDNHFRPDARPDDKSSIVYFSGNEILIKKGEGLNFPTFKQMGRPDGCVYLFTIGNTSCFLYDKESKPELPDSYVMMPVSQVRHEKNTYRAGCFALFTAWHLFRWYQTTRYCGACGHKLAHDSVERAMRCPDCGRIFYPRINPAVIVGVINDGRLLLTRYAPSSGHRGINYYALIAGFTEIGETLEQTVEREVMEEVGLRVKNIRYYKSQPWGSAGDILAGFFCEVDGSADIRPDLNELSKAFFASPSDVVLQNDDFSLTNEMMLKFKQGQIKL